jgi:hypothetical protein
MTNFNATCSVEIASRLDDMSIVAYRAAVSSIDPYEAMPVAEFGAHAKRAASEGREELLAWLISKPWMAAYALLQEEQHTAGLLESAIRSGRLGCLKLLLSNGWEMHPMRVAITAMAGPDRASSCGRINILE